MKNGRWRHILIVKLILILIILIIIINNYIGTWEERQMATYLSVAIADIERDDMITNTAWIDYLIFLFHPFIIVYYYQYLLLSYIYNESDEMVTNRLDFIFILTLFSFYWESGWRSPFLKKGKWHSLQIVNLSTNKRNIVVKYLCHEYSH